MPHATRGIHKRIRASEGGKNKGGKSGAAMKRPAAIKKTPPKKTPPKNDRKNVHSRKWHEARKQALSWGRSEADAKEGKG